MKHLWFAALIAPVLTAFALISAACPVTAASAAQQPLILILDPGHGGEDGGAIAPDGTLESDINLDISLRMDALARFWGIDTRMTRQAESIDYPSSAHTLADKKKADQNARLKLINETPGAVLISIHQNNFTAAAPHGIQVFYGDVSFGGDLAVCMQENLNQSLCPGNRRMAEPIDDGIYLMRNARCPAILVECGFLSNPEELNLLKTETYRTELAAVMLASFLQYIRGTTL